MDIEQLEGLRVPPQTPGVYFSLLPSGEIKIGMAGCIAKRHTAADLRGARILAVSPGWRGVEADLHARFRPYRSRQQGEALVRETYNVVPPLVSLIAQIREHGFTIEDLRRAVWKGASFTLRFDAGPALALVMTYLPLTESGELLPRYILERMCPSCGQDRNSLEFLTDYTIESLGQRSKRKYLVLQSADQCSACSPSILPWDQCFPGGKTSMRIGRLVARCGSDVQGYDRDWKEWTELKNFGLRRMAKSPRKIRGRGSPTIDHMTLRLQPSTSRHGRAQGALT